MKRTDSRKSATQKELEALHAAAAAPRSVEAQSALQAGLRSAHSLVVSTAARLVAENVLEGFRSELTAAFTRFLGDPDPSCVAKIAALEALDRMESQEPEPFLRAVRCRQLEPAFGGPIDTAVPVRGRGLLALARLGYHDLLLVAGDLLADPEPGVRQASAEAIEAFGQRAGAALLLFKLRSGDEEALVTLACLAGLLTLAPDVGLPTARALLSGEDEGLSQLAAVALGQSARDDALGLLLELLRAMLSPSERALVLRGLGHHRSERALAALLEIVATGARGEAVAAVGVLATRTFETDLRRRVEEAARRNARVNLSMEIAQAFAST